MQYSAFFPRYANNTGRMSWRRQANPKGHQTVPFHPFRSSIRNFTEADKMAYKSDSGKSKRKYRQISDLQEAERNCPTDPVPVPYGDRTREARGRDPSGRGTGVVVKRFATAIMTATNLIFSSPSRVCRKSDAGKSKKRKRHHENRCSRIIRDTGVQTMKRP